MSLLGKLRWGANSYDRITHCAKVAWASIKNSAVVVSNTILIKDRLFLHHMLVDNGSLGLDPYSEVISVCNLR